MILSLLLSTVREWKIPIKQSSLFLDVLGENAALSSFTRNQFTIVAIFLTVQQKIRVCGVSGPFSLSSFTSQVSCATVSSFLTFATLNFRFSLFGLTNNLTIVLFIVGCGEMVFCVLSFTVPVIARGGTPRRRKENILVPKKNVTVNATQCEL